MQDSDQKKYPKAKRNKEHDLIPSIYRQPGFGIWSASTNGYGRFLEAAIHNFKEAAARCADQGLDEEYEIFVKRAQELQEKLNDHELSN